jgi:hypothetical protein
MTPREIENGNGKWRWTKKKAKAAALVAEDRLTDERIAREADCSRAQLARWKLETEFRRRVAALVEAQERVVFEQGIGRRMRRVRALDDRWRALMRIAEERAADPSRADRPGGQTGLIVRTVKQVGSGAGARIVEEFELDAALLRELRAHEEQAARELGQWREPEQETPQPSIALSQVVITSREDAKAYLERMRNGSLPLPRPPAEPSLADALRAAGDAVPPADDAEPPYAGEGI